MSMSIAKRKKVMKEKNKSEAKAVVLSRIKTMVDLSFKFLDRSGNSLSKEVIFKELEIDSTLVGELIKSDYLSYCKSNNDELTIKFNIKLFGKREVEEYPFDRNNDVAYLHFLKYSEEYCKLHKKAAKVKPKELIENMV